ncbi:DNA topoisomerase 3 [Thermodesulfovibrio thiophilus]|uniref:DNA topoisomerase 3 n=1 Tax=Thermodesulfovibrio thiophilus TaxID=340095 RepID=UPI00041D10C9|nr:DNA topoisomerase 3 [Thermodesulfovibrio thiophilus]
MKLLLLTEKPSVAVDFANALGAKNRRDGYIEGDNHVITWAYGHLCALKPPEEYNPEWKKWDIAHLPIIPEQFQYRVIQSAAKQFKIIKELIHRSDVSAIVNCGDAGREGELIQRLILKLAKNKKPVYRFWTSEALTADVIRRGMQNLKPEKEFDRLYQSALARQWADWLVGINATRAVTVKSGKGELFSIGRVQTAVLALVVQRQEEIKNFKPVTYYNVNAEFSGRSDAFKGIYFKKIHSSENKEADEKDDIQGLNSMYALAEKNTAEAIAEEVNGKEGIIEKVVSKVSAEKPPELFSLTTLQQEANRMFSFPADKTLDIAQSLYEKKLLSYPRTESRHLDPGYVPHVKKILHLLVQTPVKFSLNRCNVDPSSKRVFDASKLTDHHALIPQGIPTGQLSQDEFRIYELVLRRFISAFYPDCKFKNTSVYIKVQNHNFIARGKTLIDAGWREVYGGLKGDVILPVLKEQEKVLVKSAEAVTKQTQPPPRYTDASLLEVMANAHKVVTDQSLKKILRENAGIGTPATRAGILSALKDRHYLIKDGKNFTPSEKAIFLIKNLLRDEKVASPEYTALWEQELDRIARGEVKDISSFLNSIKSYVHHFVEKIKNAEVSYQGSRSFTGKSGFKKFATVKAGHKKSSWSKRSSNSGRAGAGNRKKTERG